MEQAGIIKTITGIVNARTSDGQVRQLMAGDKVYENEVIETSAGSQVSIELNDGKTLALAENDQVVLDETVIAVVDAQDAVVAEAAELQANLENGEEITDDEELAAGNEDEDHDYDLAYYAGDQTRGEVGSRLLATNYGNENEDFPDVDGEDDDAISLTPALSATSVLLDETDMDGGNPIGTTGTISAAGFGESSGGTMALSAAGAIWDPTTNHLDYGQDGTPVWTITLDQATGEFMFIQHNELYHGPDGNDHDAPMPFEVTVVATNAAGGSATTTFTATIEDDGPVFVPGVESETDQIDVNFITDETSNLNADGLDDGNIDGSAYAAVDFGEDGPLTPDALSMSVNGVPEANYEWDTASQTLTFYQVAGGDATWQIEVTEAGLSGDIQHYNYEFTQLSAVDHGPDGNDHDAPMTWTVTAAASDGDEDIATQTINVTINDDGPRLTGVEITSFKQSSEGGETIEADLSAMPNVFEHTINDLKFSAWAAEDDTPAEFYDAGPGAGVKSPNEDMSDERLQEVNYIVDEDHPDGGSSEFIRMEMPDGKIGYQLGINFSEFYTDRGEETEALEIRFFMDGTQVYAKTVLANSATGELYETTVDYLGGFDMVEFHALNDPSSTGVDNSDFGIQNLSVTTERTVLFEVEGQVSGEAGADGPLDDPNTGDQFFLWNDGEAVESYTEFDGNDLPLYTITMNAVTGDWTFEQFQEMESNEGKLDIAYRLYDGDGDWSQGNITISEFIDFTDADTVNGGDGYQTLLVEGENALDFSNVDTVERIHLNDPDADQNLILDLDDVLDMTDNNNNNILHITGEDTDTVTLMGVGTGTDEWTQDSTNLGLFTNNGTGETVTIAPVDDGIDIQVDVDNGGQSFDV